MTRKGPAQIERRATARPSYAADRRRAIIISILIHLCILAVVILGLPLLPHRELAVPDKPIAIALVEAPPEPEPQPEPVSTPAPDQAPEVSAAASAADTPVAPAPQPEEAPSASDALPYDPSFNPFAAQAPQVTERSSIAPSSPKAPSQPQAQAAAPGDDAGNGQDIGGAGMEQAGPPGPPTSSGSPVGDPLLHPQYLRLQLNGYVNVRYAPQLHVFLQNLIRCGVVPVPATDPNLSVEADVDFTPLGTVRTAHLTNQGAFSDPAYQKAASALMSALTQPNCANMHLPPQYYPVWGQIHLSFFQRIPGQ